MKKRLISTVLLIVTVATLMFGSTVASAGYRQRINTNPVSIMPTDILLDNFGKS